MGPPSRQERPYTYADYLQWPDEERWEIIDGVAYDMSPAPGRAHQRALLDLARILAELTDAGDCETYVAPFDVRLGEDTEHDSAGTVVQPDISVFCRPEVLDDHGAHGAPDLVVEILSPTTSYKDQTAKLALYERHRVREYWVVNPEGAYVMVYRLGSAGRYGKPDYYTRDEAVHSEVLAGARIALERFVGTAG